MFLIKNSFGLFTIWRKRVQWLQDARALGSCYQKHKISKLFLRLLWWKWRRLVRSRTWSKCCRTLWLRQLLITRLFLLRWWNISARWPGSQRRTPAYLHHFWRCCQWWQLEIVPRKNFPQQVQKSQWMSHSRYILCVPWVHQLCHGQQIVQSGTRDCCQFYYQQIARILVGW